MWHSFTISLLVRTKFHQIVLLQCLDVIYIYRQISAAMELMEEDAPCSFNVVSNQIFDSIGITYMIYIYIIFTHVILYSIITIGISVVFGCKCGQWNLTVGLSKKVDLWAVLEQFCMLFQNILLHALNYIRRGMEMGWEDTISTFRPIPIPLLICSMLSF